ncbi:solute carrier family 66 member 3-like [Saccoglossus kowalevskii]
MLVLYFQKFSTMKIFLFGLTYFIFVGAVGIELIPIWVLSILMSLVIPASSGSKIIQLQKIIASQDSGQVSLLTWAIALFTATGRTVTTIIGTQDIQLLANYSLAALLNLCMVIAIVVYSKGKKKIS